MNIDLAIVARDLKLPPDQIQKTVELLDEGNSIPFITRFRKDQTGGLNEQQILGIKQRVAQLRALAERKGFVVKSIESQGKLTDELKTLIEKATSNRKLEDLYHPFKPKKQSRATVARQQQYAHVVVFTGAFERAHDALAHAQAQGVHRVRFVQRRRQHAVVQLHQDRFAHSPS